MLLSLAPPTALLRIQAQVARRPTERHVVLGHEVRAGKVADDARREGDAHVADQRKEPGEHRYGRPDDAERVLVVLAVDGRQVAAGWMIALAAAANDDDRGAAAGRAGGHAADGATRTAAVAAAATMDRSEWDNMNCVVLFVSRCAAC